MDQQANSSEASNVQDCSKTTNVIEKTDLTSTTESKGKFNISMFSMLMDGGSY